jgi:hypothetical protein
VEEIELAAIIYYSATGLEVPVGLTKFVVAGLQLQQSVAAVMVEAVGIVDRVVGTKVGGAVVAVVNVNHVIVLVMIAMASLCLTVSAVAARTIIKHCRYNPGYHVMGYRSTLTTT